MPCHSHAGTVVTMSGPSLPPLPSPIALHFQRERLYFHCRAMKCLCMTVRHCAINLTLAELTGQKPMQPLLGTEHYQCMDSLFIRGSIRHCSLCFHTEYETGSKLMLAEEERGQRIVLNWSHCSCNTGKLEFSVCLT